VRKVRIRVPARYPLIVAAALITAVAAISGLHDTGRESAADAVVTRGDPPSGGYAALAARSVSFLEHSLYAGHGWWHMCVPVMCFTKNRDWGADALTNDLYLRWSLGKDRGVLPYLRALSQTSHLYLGTDPAESSDTAMWDAVADIHDYLATGSGLALTKAEAAFGWLDRVRTKLFGAGACPQVDYQWAKGKRSPLKTLETGSNYMKAALLLYQATHRQAYLARAITAYGIARRYFLSRSVPLYTVYLLDNGKHCTPIRGLYFASVNGNMIWAGATLAADTGNPVYLRQAIATAQAVRGHLSDGTGVFADLQADNDIAEPLIEAMYLLATRDHQAFARTWLLTAASAAASDMSAQGTFGRFFDGPPPQWLATAWQDSGGVALVQAAAALDPQGGPAHGAFWAHARFVPDDLTLRRKPLRITFTGRAIALMGTIGARCCVAGHAGLLVDGTPTTSQVGIWQNRTSPSIAQFNQVLFAWRWPVAGRHTITIEPGAFNGVEGGSFFYMIGYQLVS
jgi:hypothetical protein